MGAEAVYVLDGGLRAWMQAGLPTAAGPVQREPAVFRARRENSAVRDFAQMKVEIEKHGQILDARSEGRFAGSAPEPRPGLSSGHMPGAIKLPYTEFVAADGRLKAPGDLAVVLAARGVDLEQPITTTCGSGVTAAVLTLGLARCGALHASLYDGSWAEYAQRPEAVIATGSLDIVRH